MELLELKRIVDLACERADGDEFACVEFRVGSGREEIEIESVSQRFSKDEWESYPDLIIELKYIDNDED